MNSIGATSLKLNDTASLKLIQLNISDNKYSRMLGNDKHERLVIKELRIFIFAGRAHYNCPFGAEN